MNFRSAKNLPKIEKMAARGSPKGVRLLILGRPGGLCGAAGGVRRGLKPLRVWQGSWARHLSLKFRGLEIWDLAKPDRNLVLKSSTPGSPLAGGRRKARARIPPGLFMGLSLCGAWV